MVGNLRARVAAAYEISKAEGLTNLRFTHHRLSVPYLHSAEFVRQIVAICKQTLAEPWTFRVESSLGGFMTHVIVQFVHGSLTTRLPPLPASPTVSV